MRLFLVGILLLAVSGSGCKKDEDPADSVGLRVAINYSEFKPGCVTLTVEDTADAKNTKTVPVNLDGAGRRGTLSAAVLGQSGWGALVKVTARAYETECDKTLVAQDANSIEMPPLNTKEGSRIRDVTLNLQAEDQDEDGFVAKSGAYPGTDCNDTKGIGASIYPGAPEKCNGVDNNCSGDEDDATDRVTYYKDKDKDGHGDPSDPEIVVTCPATRPANTSTHNYVDDKVDDCNDNNSQIYPGRSEFICDGQDDNCNEKADDAPFDVGANCTTVTGCTTTKACSADRLSSVCTTLDDFVPWYIDTDGDGHAGTTGGQGCTPPNDPTATRENSDCDESSRYSAQGKLEVCDKLDNDCDGFVDEEGVCGSTVWGGENSVGGTGTVWNVVTPYDRNKAWLAGDGNKLVHIDGSTRTTITDCTGSWKAAWSDSTGRIFIGSGGGKFATRAPSDTGACPLKDGPATASINGMIGFEQGTNRKIYAVDSQGRIILWDYEAGTIIQVERVSANLKAIHGVSPNTLMAVGQEDSSNLVGAWSAPATGDRPWFKENLGSAATAGYLLSVQVLTPKLAYAVGDSGLFLEKANGVWTKKTSLEHPDLGTSVTARTMMAFGSKAIYVATSATGKFQHYNGTSWSVAFEAPTTLNSLAGTTPGELWGVGGAGTLVRWQPDLP